MVAKVSNGVQGWQGKLLSYGGTGFRSLSDFANIFSAKAWWNFREDHYRIYQKVVLSQIEKIIANFFWGKDDINNKFHWKKWSDLCFPILEGEAGFRSLSDFANVFSAKARWNFRTDQSLLNDFLSAKYYKRLHPVARKWPYGQSHNWKRLMEIKEDAEKHILWKIGVNYFFEDGKRNSNKLRNVLPHSIVNDILEIGINIGREDKPIWMIESTEKGQNCP
ncbi:uncharacterized protein [Nicotiana tomentosiformis]|uniref:uncharacterized protein n=1 Tax=Nicotiana tomentosiformis TaxID=4098 RepID=UPI00388C74AD